MKLYKTADAILVENNNQFYSLAGHDWQNFINDDDLFQKVESMLDGLNAVDTIDEKIVLAPIGEQQ